MNYQKKNYNPITVASKIEKTIPFTVASKRIKFLGINLTKEVKDLCTQNYKALMKETEQDTNKNIFCVHRLEEVIFKYPYHLKQSID